jgi:pyridoxal biosynthesis lyase PdxS
MSVSTDLANEALKTVAAETDEIARSEKVAETLNALQGVIERNARELLELNKNIKEKREMLKSALENNTEINEAVAKAKQVTNEIKEKKAKASNDPAIVSLKLQVAEIAQNKKEIEETLSSHLVNYHQLTGSTSFDTADGDQWEFQISARVKNKK